MIVIDKNEYRQLKDWESTATLKNEIDNSNELNLDFTPKLKESIFNMEKNMEKFNINENEITINEQIGQVYIIFLNEGLLFNRFQRCLDEH
jgi:hypothetical protein